ncbi:MAG TPA: alpha/beta hydrolase [Casimicrobiaceae bacterium]|jgi:acetyl esterase/lipase|nr:alpha/beta hydrolase [Casimicrobiaceae bacterium]
MSRSGTDLPTPALRETHVYKVIDGREIRADVMGARPLARKPALVWIHGGGLIFGSRTVSPREPFVRALLERDFVVVSIDHRLAPETKLPGIVDDVRDAWRWLTDVGPGRFGIDPERVAMGGGSAGAYLSLMGGYLLEPRPRAIASFWGYGDITAPWEADPSSHYREQYDVVTRAEAVASLAGPAADPSVAVDRSNFYLYCRQHGKWLEEVTAHDPRDDDRWFDRYCPIRNVSAAFPPTILVHGTADTDVPHEESARLAARFAEERIEHEFISLAGVGHGFAGARPGQVEAAEAAVVAFLRAKLMP